jgi:diguanylate cyclase (GGDEF)-like protein
MRFRDAPLLASALLIVGVALAATWTASGWVGKPFPGFLVLGNGVIASAGLSHWPATADGDIYQHEILSVDGAAFEGATELARYVDSRPVGTRIRYRLSGGGEAFDRIVATRRFDRVDFGLIFGAYLLNGLVMAAAGLGILFLRGRHPLSEATVPLLLICSLWGLTAMDLYGPYRFFRLHALCEALLFAGFLRMSLDFPQRARFVGRHPWVRRIPYVLGGALGIAYQLALYHPRYYVSAHQAAIFALGGSLVVVVASQVWRFVRRSSFEARQRIKVLALGTACALIPPVGLMLGSVLSGGKTPQNMIAFTAFLFPLSVGYAVIRHDLLDVDVLIRRSLTYAVLTALVAGSYALVLGGVEAVVRESLRESSVFPLVFSVICVAVLLPARDRIQSLVDRLLFRTTYDFQRLVETSSARMASVSKLAVIADDLSSVVETALGPEKITLYVRRAEKEPWLLVEPGGRLVEHSEPGSEPGSEMGEPGGYESSILDLVAGAQVCFDLDSGGLAVPLHTEGTLVAAIVLARRSSGKHYGGDDRALLQTLANQGAVAIRNALALERLEELNRDLESTVAERTQELEGTLEELRVANQVLEELSTTDGLTGLRTRRAAMEQLSSALDEAGRNRWPLSVIMLDLDYFKQVNDTHGHLAGDEVLRMVSDLMRGVTRLGDIAGRYGGEELILVTPKASIEHAIMTAEHLRMKIEAHRFQLQSGEELRVTASFGVAELSGHHGEVDDLIGAADAALYRAKYAGRNCVEVAS